MMPEWLLKQEAYVPQKDADTFINKSIFSMLKLLSKVSGQSSRSLHHKSVHATVQLLGTLVWVLLVSVSQNQAFLKVAGVYLLVMLALLPGHDILRVLKTSLVVVLFTAVILVPSALQGNLYSLMMVTSKVFLTVTCVNILSKTSNWHELTAAFKHFRLPDVFILVVDITLKYIVMLGTFSVEMLYALKLRSVGKNNNKQTALSGVVGTLFIKSTEMAEDMYAAMMCRGFTGDYKVIKTMRWGLGEALYGLAHLSLLVAYIYLGRA